MNEIISKIDTKLIINELYKTNTIIEKKYVNLICSSYY